MNIEYRTYNLSKRQKIHFILVGYFCIFFLCLLFYHSLLLSTVTGFSVVFLTKHYKKYLAEKRQTFLLVQFKDVLYSLSASISTGRQMNEALKDAMENIKLIYKEDTPMVMELKYMVKSIYENRDKEEDLLISLAKRSKIEDIYNFVDVYLACRSTGGDLEKNISGAIEIITDKMSIEREIKTLTAQKEFEGKIIAGMPIGVIFCLNVFYPDYLQVMYETFMGRIIMTIALGGILVAYYLTLKLTRIEV